MTKFYVAGPMGRDRASLEFQLWDSDDEIVSPYEAEEIILMPNVTLGAVEANAALGKTIAEAHRGFTRSGTTWRLVYDGGGEEYVPPVVDPELVRLLAEEEEIERATRAYSLLANEEGKNDDGLYVTNPSLMKTWLGRRLDVLDVTPDDVNVYDIAHALARQCRYNGHVEHFLSVARHSVWVSTRLRNESPELRMWGLLHDASEAFIGDMIKPLKHSSEMNEFVILEERVEQTIAEAYGLPYPMPDIVKQADKFVAIEVEIGMGLRETHVSTYAEDEELFLERYHDLEAEMR